jgi:thiol-disulfide isomerase/thioredoxin
MNIKVNSSNDALNLSKLLKDGNWMVLYYAEWCGHCKTMKPEWKKAVDNVSNNKDTINVAEIESSHIGNLSEPPNVDGYPTIKMYNNGKEVAKFEDERISDKIEKFAIDNSSKIVTKPKKKGKIAVKNNISNNLINNKYHTVVGSLDNNNSNNSNNKANNKNILNILEDIKQPVINNRFVESPKAINSNKLKCNDIMKAKVCKSNLKCIYDYNNYKCINKDNNAKEIQKTLRKTKQVSKNKKSKSVQKKKRTKLRKLSENKKIRNTTSKVFKQLITSFKRIGNEAEKDAKLLKTASNKL